MIKHLHLANIAKKIVSWMLYIWIGFIINFVFFNYKVAEDWLIAIELLYLAICVLCILYINHHKENVKLPKIDKKF